MSCTHIQDLFSPSLDGRLDVAEQMIFDHHMHCCSSCQRDFEQYQRLFAAVASLSGSVMEGPAPLPETVRSFRGLQKEGLSWWGRFGSTAAVAVLLAVVAWGAFQAGQGGKGEPAVDVAGREMEFVAPSEPAALQMRSLAEGLQEAAVMLELADTHPGPDTRELVACYLEDINNRSAQILKLGEHSLGSLEVPAKAISADLRKSFGEMEKQIRSRGEPRQLIRLTKNRFYERRVIKRCGELENLVRAFPRPQGRRFFVAESSVDPLKHKFMLALHHVSRGDWQEGQVTIKEFKRLLLNQAAPSLYRAMTDLERHYAAASGQPTAPFFFVQSDHQRRGVLHVRSFLSSGSRPGQRTALVEWHTSREHPGGRGMPLHPRKASRTSKLKKIQSPLGRQTVDL